MEGAVVAGVDWLGVQDILVCSPRGRLDESWLVATMQIGEKSTSLLIDCNHPLFRFSWHFPSSFSSYPSINTIQTKNTIGVVLKTSLGMAPRVPSQQKHANLQWITLVRGRRISRHRKEWPVRCQNRLVIADILGESTTSPSRKAFTISSMSLSGTPRYAHCAPSIPDYRMPPIAFDDRWDVDAQHSVGYIISSRILLHTSNAYNPSLLIVVPSSFIVMFMLGSYFIQ